MDFSLYHRAIFMILCFTIYQGIWSQSMGPIHVYYEKKVDKLIDTTESGKTKSTISKFNQIVSEDVKNLMYVLRIGEDCALFHEQKSLIIGSSKNVMRNFTSSYGGTAGTFYINQKDSVYLNMREFSGAQFKVQISPKQWELHPEEQKYIGDYKCIKATTMDTIANPKGVFTSDVVAWFSPELPGLYGPAGYFGLPGLILELQNGKISLEAKESVFDATIDSQFEIEKQKGMIVTERQYDSIVEKKAKEFFKISEF